MRRGKITTCLAGAVLAGAVLCAPLPALAQSAPGTKIDTTGFALQRLTPAFAGDRFYSVPSPYVAGPSTFHMTGMIDYALNPLLLSRVPGINEPTKVVSDQLYLRGNATLALFNRVALNFDVPAVLVNDGEDPVYRGTTYGSPHNVGFADIRVGARVRLLGEQHDPFQLAVQGLLWIPTGSPYIFSGDGVVRGMPQLVLGGFTDRIVWSFMAGAHFRPTTVYNNVEIGSSMELGAGIAVRLLRERQLQIGPEATLGFALENQKRRNTHSEILLGARYRFKQDYEVGLAAGPGLTPGYGTPDARIILSFTVTPDPSTWRKPPAAAAAAPAAAKDSCPKAGAGKASEPNATPAETKTTEPNATPAEAKAPEPKNPACPALLDKNNKK